MDQKDYQQLAGEFIELWQKQLETVVTDKRFVEQMFAGLQQMANVATPSSHEQPTSTAPNDVDERLSELDFRLRMAEKRIIELESKPAPTKRAKPAAKRSPKGSAKKA